MNEEENKMDNQEFIKALNNIVEEKKIDKNIILEAMKLALTSAYKKNFNSLTNVRVDIDSDTGEIKVYSCRTVVKKVTDENLEISAKKAKEIDSTKKVGDIILEEVTPKDFGRVAAATAKQVVMQKLGKRKEKVLLKNLKAKKKKWLQALSLEKMLIIIILI